MYRYMHSWVFKGFGKEGFAQEVVKTGHFLCKASCHTKSLKTNSTKLLMADFKFTPRNKINAIHIRSFFERNNLSLSEWKDYFDTTDEEKNIEGKINRWQYFARYKMTERVPYKFCLLFETSESLLLALLAIGEARDKAENNVVHEERHSEKMREKGMTPIFGLFVDYKSPPIGEQRHYQAFAIPKDGYRIRYARRMSIQEELHERIYIADIEGKSTGDQEIIDQSRRLIQRYIDVKSEKGLLPQWRM